MAPQPKHSVHDGVSGKECRRCYEWKPLDDYYSKGKTTFDGKDSMCKSCFNDRKTARRNGVELSRANEHKTLNGIEKKHCGACSTWKSLEQFYVSKSRRDGLSGMCKPCFLASKAKYRESDKGKETESNYNKEHINETAQRNAKRYREKKHEIIPKVVAYNKKRYKEDPMYRLRVLQSSYINKTLRAKKQYKPARTMELVGCSREQLQCHLERQFDEYMTWSNQGRWHIDHRIPVSAFDMNNAVERKAAWHYLNLQPLWGDENIRKSNTFDVCAKVEYMRHWTELVM
jgi:hypothetical protein